MGARAESIAARGAATAPGWRTTGGCGCSLIHRSRVPRKNNTEFAAIEAEPVHFCASLLGVLLFGETDEPETTATTSGAIKRRVDVAYFTELGKNCTKLIRASFIAEVVNFDGMQT
jgi:hypothetical protein